VIGITQYFHQSWIGLKYLGEEHILAGLRGIAEFVSQGLVSPLFLKLFPGLSSISVKTYNLRAYGTLPHPNILSALFFVGLMINIYLLYRNKRSLDGGRKTWQTIVLSLSLVLIFTGQLVSFSRTGWVLSGVGALVWLAIIFLRYRRTEIFHMKYGAQRPQAFEYQPGRVAYILGLLIMIAAVNLFAFGPQIKDRLLGTNGFAEVAADQSVMYRAELNKIAWSMVKANPIFGVGERNFVVKMDNYSAEKIMPDLHQPVHNIYLLIWAEAGIFGLLSFVLAIYFIVRHGFSLLKSEPLLGSTMLIIFFGFLFWGFFDHFLLSIHQGSLAFWLVAGLLSAKQQKNSP